MLRLTREDVAQAAQVAVATLADFEVGRRQPHPRTIAAIRLALELAGVEFIEENGGGPGVRLRGAGKRQEPSHELRSVGPEDETRGGPQALEQPEIQTDD